MMLEITDAEAKEMTTEQLRASVNSFMAEMEKGRMCAKKLSVASTNALVCSKELKRRGGCEAKGRRGEGCTLLNLYPPA